MTESAWTRVYLPEAQADLKRLTPSVQAQVIKAIVKVPCNPLPRNEGGYGKPLRNTAKSKLAGLCKVKLRELGIRVIYKPVRTEHSMLVIVVGIRSDDEAYRVADQRRRTHNI